MMSQVSTRRSELSQLERSLEEKSAELEQVQQKIEASSKLLDSIKSSISNPTTPLSDKTGSIQTSTSLPTHSKSEERTGSQLNSFHHNPHPRFNLEIRWIDTLMIRTYLKTKLVTTILVMKKDLTISICKIYTMSCPEHCTAKSDINKIFL